MSLAVAQQAAVLAVTLCSIAAPHARRSSSLSDLAYRAGPGRIDTLIRPFFVSGWALLSNFRTIDRETAYLLPPSVNEWLPERHLARFVVEVIDGLVLSAMSRSYRGTGSASYHPALLLGLLVYGYATGVFSSRKLERATYDSVAFRFIAANDHPDHDTIATFRQRFLDEISGLFVRVLELAREMGMLKMGTVALDGP